MIWKLIFLVGFSWLVARHSAFAQTTVVPSPTSVPQPGLGPCAQQGFTTCCNTSFPSCAGVGGACFCDEICFTFDDCCSDVLEIGCIGPSTTPTPVQGSCAALGFNGCCTGTSCLGSDNVCYCDQSCHNFGDCCPDIEQVGCFSTGSSPTIPTPSPTSFPFLCQNNGAVRLVGGSSAMQGRVEICFNGMWGTVCDDQFNNMAAQVVCTQLNYTSAGAEAYPMAQFGQGTGPISISKLSCSGNEESLLECVYSNSTSDCIHGDDAGVQCGPAQCMDGQLRLVNGLSPLEGRVEICLRGVWGTVCDSNFDMNDARVICRQLGYPSQVVYALSNAYFGAGNGSVNAYDLGCVGTEANITSCTFQFADANDVCDHSNDASVGCGQVLGCFDGDVRLVGGGNVTEGRVEVCIGNQWGTVCDDFWSVADARVVCRQLGHPTNGSEALGQAFFGQGTGQIFLDNVVCTGDESTLISCPHITNHNCQHSEDAGVRCPDIPVECNDTDIRLVNGNNDLEGRVEVCLNGVWGTVCDDLWDGYDARVVCKQLGLPYTGAQAYIFAHFGQGTGPINLDNLQCTGNETKLVDCPYTFDHNCIHLEDAGVICGSAACNDGDVRLASGNSPLEGRVLICLLGVWGTVCDDFWGIPDAQVVCRSLGYPSAGALAFSSAYFGQGSGPINLDDVQCTGTEAGLLDCTYNPTHNCVHFEDAGVRCENASCTTGMVRLVNGFTPYEGRVEVCNNGLWGTVCDDFWGAPDAQVVCRQLGLPSNASTAIGTAYFGPGTGLINMDNVGCSGTEQSIFNCSFLTTHNCVHGEDASVVCLATQANCSEGEVRLVGGQTATEGRVEICLGGVWGTVCDDLWGTADARVVCGQLGLTALGAQSFSFAAFGQGNGPIHLDNVQCTGTENSLLQCTYSPQHNCAHFEDAGVRCFNSTGCTHGDVRLVGGLTSSEGRVEVCISGVWGTVCDDFWNYQDARVVCRQLRLPFLGAQARTLSFYGVGSGPILLDDVQCTGDEQSLVNCTYNPSHNCAHFEDAGVVCGVPECNETDIRLVGGNDNMEGRVEVCLGGVWGTVCDDLWGTSDARVTCRQLGLPDAAAQAYSLSQFGAGSGLIALDNVDCRGNETLLINCPHDSDTSDCFHFEDAGVSCAESPNECTDGQIRLVAGGNATQGRVEVCLLGQWGSVCDDQWGAQDAAVVCRQLGYPTGGPQAVIQAFFGQSTGPIHIDDVGCTGSESALVNCTFNLENNCAHSEDAGVICGQAQCNESSIRLVGGSGDYEGRVEVCYYGAWGTVCDDFWGTPDAMVVCNQLGYPTNGATAFGNAFFGAGSGPISFDDVQCGGGETSLFQCNFNPNHNCNHFEDAGVRCMIVTPSPTVAPGPGPCAQANFTECCNQQNYSNCFGVSDTTCYCDQSCFEFNDCCSDVEAIGCIAPTSPPPPVVGSCVMQGFNGCCVGTGSQCLGSDGVCYCDQLCYNFGDCCNDIQDTGCYSTGSSPTLNTPSPTPSLSCTNYGDVRLVGGSSGMEGRVEICINGQWGTVCDDQFDNPAARVVCAQLNYSTAGAEVYPAAQFGQGSGTIQITELNCQGTEPTLLSCLYTNVTDFCTHADDVGVQCGPAQCTDGQLRLLDGLSTQEGRVEICVGGVWGTICDNNWDMNDARVVCSQLGLPSQMVTALPNAYFGAGNGSVNAYNFGCTGTETNISSCPFQFADPNNACDHSDDASVLCGTILNCLDGDIRLVGGDDVNGTEGRVEVCANNQWGTVCDDLWGVADARVVCRQLGYPINGAEAVGQAFFGQGTGQILLDNVGCTGDESTLISCPHITNHNCQHSEDAGVRCPDIPVECNNTDIRLVGGNSDLEGRVEVCLFGRWGTVCDDLWDGLDARAVCRQLGYPFGGAQAYNFAYFGQGTGPINMDNVQCTGNESFLVNCTFTTNHNCFHFEDAGVVCANASCTEGAVRLAGSSSNNNEGRVEICAFGSWGTICDDSWNAPDAQVACRSLGLPSSGAIAFGSAYFGQGSGPINLDDVQCTGNEAGLLECNYNPTHNCVHFEDAGVRCLNASCTNGMIRLVNGYTPYEGRVEVCANGAWGTVCDDLWGTPDAQVVCRQLGLPTNASTAIGTAYFGPGTGAINLDNVQCTGTEQSIFDCTASSTHNCVHAEDASVVCLATPVNCSEGEIRLLGGQSSTEGRVEICLGGVWGTVCDDLWGTADARVVCGQLGFNPTGAQAFSFATFGQGIGPIHLDNVQCVGTETSLLQCTYAAQHNCIHFEDAGVRCVNGSGECNHGDVRLLGGTTNSEGRVEVCVNGVWGTVCDDSWTYQDARVVCRQLGLPYQGAQARTLSFFGVGSGPILLDDVQCTGDEQVLVNCTYNPNHNCLHFEDAGVVCGVAQCNETDIRLVNGEDNMEGRVEVCLGGQWGTVCDDLWGTSDARVTCRQLGLPDAAAQAYSLATFGVGTGPIVLDNVNCRGNETTLVSCPHDPDTSDCFHFEDAGVSCAESPMECNDSDIRLVGGNATQGRVEVCLFGQWGSVCDDFWGTPDAVVVCRQLGLPTGGQAVRQAFFGQGTGPIHIDDVGCTGSESALTDCNYNPENNCAHSEDAGVICGEVQCNDGDVRLVGGTSDLEGRVEVCNFGQWGTVCDDSWDILDARVVCKSLGYPYTGAVSYGSAYFGAGSGPINLDDVQCTGNENSVLNCTFNPNHNCVHFEDAGVMCANASCTTGRIRLVNGFTPYEGRVEVCNGGVWGTVCDDFWGAPDAQVVCRQLGLPTNASTAIGSAYFGPGTGPINLDNVQCTGTEQSIFNCSFLATHNCVHREDASVVCLATQANCSEGEVRLVGGQSSTEGRVEICLNGEWGTVCDDLWGAADARVVCGQLGFSRTGAQGTSFSQFGQGIGPIHLDNVQCTGTESSLLQCTYSPIHNCAHFEDAGVICVNGSAALCTHGDLRLVGGSDNSEGRVEVCLNGVWGTVCDDFWGNVDARVVCRQLGLPFGGAQARTLAAFGVGSGPILLDDVQCTGNEQWLVNCTYNPNHNCAHFEDAGVVCAAPQCNETDIRIVGGSNNMEGRVEVCIGGQWGTVCDDQWGAPDAQVACRQLGLPFGGAEARGSAFFGAGTGPIVLDDVQCTGSELLLAICTYNPNHNCGHFEDAGVVCAAAQCNETDIRLVGGSNITEGRVEVCVNGQWGTVCDDLWGTPDARVVCRQLGLPFGGAQARGNAFFGVGTGPINLDNVQCTGNELLLTSCPYNPNHNCGHFEDAGVVCGVAQCNEADIRLVGGTSELEGRVEICFFGQWGTVCDDSWDNSDARVVCKSLGYPYTGAVARSSAFYGAGSGPINLDDVQCTGNESSVLNCTFNPNHNCVHFEDAGVMCANASCTTGRIRLVNGFTPYEGRVEVCSNGQWGTVCDDLWGVEDAQVVCRQLGLLTNSSTAIGSAYFGLGTGPINFDNVQCVGTEQSLFDCTLLTTHNCGHSEDASVVCLATSANCSEGEVRLVGGQSVTEGRVEICLGGEWGTVCDDLWGVPDATVVCGQLGFSRIGAQGAIFSQFGQGIGPIHLDNVQCTGTESSLLQCTYSPIHNCGHIEDAGVICLNTSGVCNHGDLRLLGGTNDSEGRVEVCVGGVWGTVCDDSWDNTDARVVCRQLGLPFGGAEARVLSAFGVGSGPILLDDVQCTGNEQALVNCTYNPNHNCVHFEDAGVVCAAAQCNETDIRLVGGTNEMEGRVEVCYNGQWGTVCDDLWNTPDAMVVCRQLGYSPNGATALSNAFFGLGTGPINVDDTQCVGTESTLLSCQFNPNHNCLHFEDAGVRCLALPSATAFPVPPSSTVPPVVATSSTTAVPVQPSSTVPPGVITSAVSSTITVSSRFEERVTPTTTQTLRTTAATTSIPSSSVPSFSSTPAQPVSSTPVKLPSLSSVPVVSVVTTSFTPSRPSTSTLVVSSSTTTRNPIASSSPTAIGAVENLNIVSLNRSAVQVSFTYLQRPVSQVYFNLAVNHGNDPTLSFHAASSRSTITYVINGLRPFNPYTLSVTPTLIGTIGIPGTTTRKVFFTIEGVPSVAPSGVSLIRLNSTTLRVSWQQLSLDDARGFITNYTVTYMASGGSRRQLTMVTVSADESSAIISGLPPSVRYGVSVRAWTSAGPGPMSDVVYEGGLQQGLSSGAVAGSIIGVIAFLIIILVIGIFMIVMYRKISRNKKYGSSSVGYEIRSDMVQLTDKSDFQRYSPDEYDVDIGDDISLGAASEKFKPDFPAGPSRPENVYSNIGSGQKTGSTGISGAINYESNDTSSIPGTVGFEEKDEPLSTSYL